MYGLSKAYEKIISSLPQRLVEEMIEKKLAAHGIRFSQKRLRLLAEQLIEGEPIDIDGIFDRLKETLGFPVRKSVIEITDADLGAIQEALETYVEDLPQAIKDTLENTSRSLLESLKKDWPREAKRLKREREGFRKRLHTRWGMGIDLLRMLITVSREVGSEIHASERKAAAAPLSIGVLTRLHARGCQIAEEIVCLLESGFSDGAMARWRTLHEISAVATLIGRHGEALAERYIDHDAIESARIVRQYQKYHVRLGQAAIPDDEMEEIERRARALKERYGKEFGSSNGWAAMHLGIAEPKIDQLIAAAGTDHLLPYYKMASHNVHANPKGIFFKLGSIGESEVLLAGSSNAGLADPGQNTAISLMQITSAFALLNPTLDDLISINIIQRLSDEICDALGEAHQQLVRDDAQSRRMAAER